MRRCLIVVIFIILAMPGIARAGINTWTTNGPVGTSISALAIDPINTKKIYATDSSNVYKSIDPNVNWNPIASLPTTLILTLAINPDDPNTIYAGCDDPNFRGVHKSIDGGVSWTQVLTDLTVYAMVIDPEDPNTIYAGCKGDPNFTSGVYKSINGGNNWDPNTTGMTSTDVRALVIDPNNPGTLYAGSWDKGVFKSSDGGSIWIQINTGLQNLAVMSLAIDPEDTNILYAGCKGDPNTGGIFKSTDGGTNWSQVFQTSHDIKTIAINPLMPDILYCAPDSDGVWNSTDGGDNWSEMNTGLTNTDVLSMAIDPVAPSTIYAGTNGGGVFQYHTRGIIISSLSGNTTEAGGTATFSVRLSSEPTADVTIGINSSDTSEGSIDPNSYTDPNNYSLIFTNLNWNTAQTVTINGVNDDVDDGDQNYAIVLTAAISGDSDYDGLDPNDVPVINEDNDVAGFIVSAISGNTTELDTTADPNTWKTFSVKLSSRPTDNVTIGISSSDPNEGSVDPNSLIFSSSIDPNSLSFWNTAQTVTVTGVDDTLIDGDQTYLIVLTATSGDPNYNALNPGDVSVTNIDNEPTPSANGDGSTCFISAIAYECFKSDKLLTVNSNYTSN